MVEMLLFGFSSASDSPSIHPRSFQSRMGHTFCPHAVPSAWNASFLSFIWMLPTCGSRLRWKGHFSRTTSVGPLEKTSCTQLGGVGREVPNPASFLKASSQFNF